MRYADTTRVASDARSSLPLEALPLHQRLRRAHSAEQIARHRGGGKSGPCDLAHGQSATGADYRDIETPARWPTALHPRRDRAGRDALHLNLPGRAGEAADDERACRPMRIIAVASMSRCCIGVFSSIVRRPQQAGCQCESRPGGKWATQAAPVRTLTLLSFHRRYSVSSHWPAPDTRTLCRPRCADRNKAVA
jgi:hypothetical protein